VRVQVDDRLATVVGGRLRFRVIALLACVLGLNSADSATVGAVATELERSLHIGNLQIGLLVTVSTGVGALAALPAGVLVDRINRTRLLWVSVSIWSATMVVNGASTSFAMLLTSRLALGGVVAVAGPAVASLTGDLFPGAERAQVYGYILAGELIGAGSGYLLSGNVAAAISWRYSFWSLAVPGLILAVAIRRLLPEPGRGGRDQLVPNKTRTRARALDDPVPDGGEAAVHQPFTVRIQNGPRARHNQKHSVNPQALLAPPLDIAHLSLWRATRYILHVRTNVILIVSSALGYFFLTGLQTFAVVFLRGRFGLGQSVASTILVLLGAGSLLGVLVAGRIADRLVRRQHSTARVLVGAICFLVTAALVLPALLTTSLLVAAPLVFLAAAALGGSNPPIDAARLDIMPATLWGRAEAIRTALRAVFTATAPLVFGYVSTEFGGQRTDAGEPTGSIQAGSPGLDRTFLVMLAALAAAGVILLLAHRTYPADLDAARALEPTPASAPEPEPEPA
jgi:predicted MFS family arabinose efflux permease